MSYAPDGTDQRDLGTGGDVAWSRDGSRIWFISLDDHQLWSMNADGGDRRRVSNLAGGAGTPAAAPDGAQVAITSFTPGEDHPEIWVIDSDGSNARRLTTTTLSESPRNGHTLFWTVHPSWSADGRKIAYASARGGSSQIWVMDADGNNASQLTSGNGPEYPDCNVPEYSLDGRSIVFWSGDETRSYGEVWIMDADGTNPRRVTDTPDPRNSDNPTWSPDGGSLLFISNRDGGTGVINAWLVARAGGDPQLFAGNAGYCAWQPIP